MTRSRSVSRSRSKSASSRSRSRSRSRSIKKERSASRSRSRSPRRDKRRRSPSPRRRSRSRSRSVKKDRSRSRSRGRRDSRSVSPESGRKRHIGDREDPPANKCLGVFGLSLYTTEREVRDVFEKYGRVDSCQIVYDHATGRSRGFAFVIMESMNGAEDAKERLNDYELDGRRIRVDFSITRRPHTPTPGKYFGRSDQQTARPSGGRNYDRNYDRRSPPRRSPPRRRRSYSRSRSRSPRYRDRYSERY